MSAITWYRCHLKRDWRKKENVLLMLRNQFPWEMQENDIEAEGPTHVSPLNKESVPCIHQQNWESEGPQWAGAWNKWLALQGWACFQPADRDWRCCEKVLHQRVHQNWEGCGMCCMGLDAASLIVWKLRRPHGRIRKTWLSGGKWALLSPLSTMQSLIDPWLGRLPVTVL